MELCKEISKSRGSLFHRDGGQRETEILKECTLIINQIWQLCGALPIACTLSTTFFSKNVYPSIEYYFPWHGKCLKYAQLFSHLKIDFRRWWKNDLQSWNKLDSLPFFLDIYNSPDAPRMIVNNIMDFIVNNLITKFDITDTAHFRLILH